MLKECRFVSLDIFLANIRYQNVNKYVTDTFKDIITLEGYTIVNKWVSCEKDN